MKIEFVAVAKEIKTPLAQKRRGGELVGAWTDGLMISSDYEPGWHMAMRLFKGRRYRVTVEEIGANE